MDYPVTMRKAPFLVGVFLITFSLLTFQILQTRIFTSAEADCRSGGT